MGQGTSLVSVTTLSPTTFSLSRTVFAPDSYLTANRGNLGDYKLNCNAMGCGIGGIAQVDEGIIVRGLIIILLLHFQMN